MKPIAISISIYVLVLSTAIGIGKILAHVRNESVTMEESYFGATEHRLSDLDRAIIKKFYKAKQEWYFSYQKLMHLNTDSSVSLANFLTHEGETVALNENLREAESLATMIEAAPVKQFSQKIISARRREYIAMRNLFIAYGKQSDDDVKVALADIHKALTESSQLNDIEMNNMRKAFSEDAIASALKQANAEADIP